ncbi:protein FAM53B [Hippocampus zosterae]|uniref:protein FAM53B n=1 Tax=Hippocampus zosterae TaxID=109293 RepID=UPI00223CC0D3|nr:protein FAM53B [Hippocampus zosterae]
MRVAMVIICKKRPEKGGENVTSKSTHLGSFQSETMSQGTALFSRELADTGGWCRVARGRAAPQGQVGTSLESLWDILPEVHPNTSRWGWDVGRTSGTISSLLQDLSLTEAPASSPAAPPSKRQCRSLSCSEELHRSTWRPQGSRVWTAVEKRRCHSGGSVHGGGIAPTGFPAIRRSASISLSLSLPAAAALARPLYRSDERIPELGGPSPVSSPDSTPEPERRGGPGGLARSRSQPCVLNDKKIGVKRRRPDDVQRPSLDLAKMTQKLPNFHSLSCHGISGQCRHSEDSSADNASDDVPPATEHEPPGLNIQEVERMSTCRKDKLLPPWTGLGSTGKDVHLLGGELDIEQIERN